jgi:hypothetical protein
MELTEPIESINKQLVSLFGIDSDTGRPMFRVVSSWDQYEKRYTNVTKDGFQLLNPEVVELPKYDQRDLDYKDCYILERLVVVPAFHHNEMVEVMSYEPLWVFRGKDRMGNDVPVPPKTDACKMVIDTMYAALGKKSLVKYVDPESNSMEAIQEKQKRVDKLVEELFGDESALLGRTITGEAVAYTGEPKIITPVINDKD